MESTQTNPLERTLKLTVAVADPTDLSVVDDLRFITRYDVVAVLAGEFSMRAAIEKLPPHVRDPLLEGIAITTQTGLFDLVDFLRALEGTFDKTIPPRVPSGLKPGGR